MWKVYETKAYLCRFYQKPLNLNDLARVSPWNFRHVHFEIQMPEVLRYHPINFIQISPARVNRVSVLWCSKGVIFISHCNLEAFKIRKMQRFYTRVSKGLKKGFQGRFLMLSLDLPYCSIALEWLFLDAIYRKQKYQNKGQANGRMWRRTFSSVVQQAGKDSQRWSASQRNWCH